MPEVRCPVVGEDGETESSSDEEEISEAESDADEARGAPSVIADTLGSQEEALTQARPRVMPSQQRITVTSTRQRYPCDAEICCSVHQEDFAMLQQAGQQQWHTTFPIMGQPMHCLNRSNMRCSHDALYDFAQITPSADIMHAYCAGQC